jgi:putative DNA primase/helicase
MNVHPNIVPAVEGKRRAALFPPTPDEPIVEHAVHYASRGWSIFPAPPGEKKGYYKAKYSGGRKWGQTKDADEIRRYWQEYPDANIGIACGPSGIFVVEADTMAGHDVDGIASLAALEAEHGVLPATLQARSPSGSIHYYFNHPGFDIKNSASAIAPGGLGRGLALQHVGAATWHEARRKGRHQ